MNLGSGSERGPYLVTQTGVAPRAERPRTQMSVLRPDGRWVRFQHLRVPGVMDEIALQDQERRRREKKK